MNATPLNPLPPVQPPSASAKAQDGASPGVPFSQVLSGEIAQSRKGDERADAADASAVARSSDPAGRSATNSTDTAGAKDDAKTARDSQQGDAAPTPPDVLLGLPITPELLQRAPAAAHVAATAPHEHAAPIGTTDGRRERFAVGFGNFQPTRDVAAAQAADPARPATAAAGSGGGRAVDKPDVARVPVNPGKADFHAAMAAAGAAASGHAADKAGAEPAAVVAEQQAARQTDLAQASEPPSVIAANPAVPTAPHLAAPTADPSASNRLTPSVGSSAWKQALGEKIVWMAAGDQQTASLTLNPPDLGPLQVVLNVSNDQATASFFSAQPEVRHALESAFPRLREMMNEAGIQLGQATVSADTPRQHDTPERQAQWAPAPPVATERGAAAIPEAAHAPVHQSGRGLVDTFA